jgi:hypothetical protein
VPVNWGRHALSTLTATMPPHWHLPLDCGFFFALNLNCLVGFTVGILSWDRQTDEEASIPQHQEETSFHTRGRRMDLNVVGLIPTVGSRDSSDDRKMVGHYNKRCGVGRSDAKRQDGVLF